MAYRDGKEDDRDWKVAITYTRTVYLYPDQMYQDETHMPQYEPTIADFIQEIREDENDAICRGDRNHLAHRWSLDLAADEEYGNEMTISYRGQSTTLTLREPEPLKEEDLS